tara:strand:- start:210 stop:542 length:333 start_codon:yes stop_codon:yes gene_type:complete
MSEDNNQNGWNEYSRLVLKELENLASNIDGLKEELQEVRQEIAKMQVREDKVDELKVWKEKVDEVISPTQLKSLVDEVESLKHFKTKSITIFAVVQFMMALWAWSQKFIQ